MPFGYEQSIQRGRCTSMHCSAHFWLIQWCVYVQEQEPENADEEEEDEENVPFLTKHMHTPTWEHICESAADVRGARSAAGVVFLSLP